MKLPSLVFSTPIQNLSSPPATQICGVIEVFDVISQIARLVQLGLAQPITQPRKSITCVSYVPIVSSSICERFNAVKRATGPERRYSALNFVVFIAGATGFRPYGLTHEICHVYHEVLDCIGLRGHGVYIFRLPAVQQHKDVINLSF